MTLTKEDELFLKKIEEQKEKHRLRQKKYYEKKRDERLEYIKEYNIKKKDKIKRLSKITIEDLKELIKDFIPKTPNKPKTERTKTETTIRTYINQINQMNNIIINEDLTEEEELNIISFLRTETNNKKDIKISYLEHDKIEKTIEILRNHYINDNTFRNILNIINILTNNNIELINKLYSYYHLKIRDKRETNILEEKDKDKIIDLDRTKIIGKIEEIEEIEDKLILGLYLLIPSRRLEWRKVIIKSIKPKEKTYKNYLILTDEIIEIIFNDYKTSKIYGEQIIKIDDEYLNNLIRQYIKKKDLKDNDLLISQEINKRKEINEGNFSRKLTELLFKVYKIPITLRFLRMSHIVYFNKINKTPTTKERRILAEKMGHSIEEQLRYNKIF